MLQLRNLSGDKRKKLLAFKSTTNAACVPLVRCALVDKTQLTRLPLVAPLVTPLAAGPYSDSTAHSYLETFSWDLARAVDEFFASGGHPKPSGSAALLLSYSVGCVRIDSPLLQLCSPSVDDLQGDGKRLVRLVPRCGVAWLSIAVRMER